jgi:hypothetical protein
MGEAKKDAASCARRQMSDRIERGYFQSNSGVPNALFQTVRKRGNQE